MTVMPTPKPLPALLVERGLLSAEQLAQAQAHAARTGLSLRRVLVQQRLVPERTLAQLVAAQAGLVHVDLATQRIRPDVLALIDADTARQHAILPLFRIEETLTIAMADPLNVFVADELRLRTKCDIKRVVAGETDIQQAIERWYGPAKGGPLPDAAADAPAEASPARQAWDTLLHEALTRRAQALLLAPEPQGLQVRWRIDGVEHLGPRLATAEQAGVVARLKALAQLDITQRQQPQAGQCRLMVEGREVTLRIQCVPEADGERVTVQVHDSARALPSLEALGILPAWREELRRRLQGSAGLVLVSAGQAEELDVVLPALAAATGAAASALRGIVGAPAAGELAAAQALLAVRLLRRLCRHCAVPYEPAPELARQLGLAEHVAIFRAQGCPACHDTGFAGVVGACAWLPQLPGPEAARQLRESAQARVREGVTSWEEALRALGADA